jgi:hypothetical protein
VIDANPGGGGAYDYQQHVYDAATGELVEVTRAGDIPTRYVLDPVTNTLVLKDGATPPELPAPTPPAPAASPPTGPQRFHINTAQLSTPDGRIYAILVWDIYTGALVDVAPVSSSDFTVIEKESRYAYEGFGPTQSYDTWSLKEGASPPQLTGPLVDLVPPGLHQMGWRVDPTTNAMVVNPR